MTLQEQANTVWVCEFLGIIQKLGQGRQGPGRHHIEPMRRQIFDPGVLDGDLQVHPRGRFPQEGAFLGGRLMQGNSHIRQQGGQHQPGKACAGTHVRKGSGVRGN